MRWHVRGAGQWRHDDVWRYGFDLHRSSDKGYLSRYGLDNGDTLTSDLYIEGFDGRSSASAFGYAFQGLRQQDDSDEIPVVAPVLDYRLATDPDENGSFFTFDANALALSRHEGVNSKRVSLAGGWERPLLTDGGHLFTLGTSLRGDAYIVDYVPVDGGLRERSGFAGRVVPRASLEWRYPLLRTDGGVRHLVEPIVQAVWSPNGLNSERIPNEDSREFEFDEINLFSLDRFPGLDRVEGGTRINYGLGTKLSGPGGGQGEFLIGQTWRRRKDGAFGARSGLDGPLFGLCGPRPDRPARVCRPVLQVPRRPRGRQLPQVRGRLRRRPRLGEGSTPATFASMTRRATWSTRSAPANKSPPTAGWSSMSIGP